MKLLLAFNRLGDHTDELKMLARGPRAAAILNAADIPWDTYWSTGGLNVPTGRRLRRSGG